MIASKYNAFGVDINRSVISKLKKGITHQVEPGLTDRLDKAIKDKNKIGTAEASIFIISVPTPISNSNEADINGLGLQINCCKIKK